MSDDPDWFRHTSLAAILRGERVFSRMLVPDEGRPGELREETDEELRVRILSESPTFMWPSGAIIEFVGPKE